MDSSTIPYTLYNSNNYLVLDFETSNLDKGSALNKNNSIVCGVWKFRGAVKSIYGSEYAMAPLLDDIAKCDFIVAQHAKFELQWLIRCGLDISKVAVWDTMLAQYVFAGNRSMNLDLESICSTFGIPVKTGWIPKAIKAGLCPSSLPASEVLSYCLEDVLSEEQLFLAQRNKYHELIPVIYCRCYLTPALADIELNGMFVDSEKVKQAKSEVMIKRFACRESLEALTGGINPRSSKQVAAFLYDELKFPEPLDYNKRPILTKGGSRPTDAKTIAKFVAKTNRQKDFLKLKKDQGVLDAEWSKCIGPLSKCCEETEDHVLYASFNQSITQTHRLSSSGKSYGVQFQNFYRKYKNLFKARKKGWVIVEADAAQLEFRVAGFLGHDDVVLKDIVNKEDIHSFTASVMNDVTYEWMIANKKTNPVAEQYRTEAKPETFKPLYGGQSGTEKQKKYYAAFKDKYKGVAAAQQHWVDLVLRFKKLTTITGLVFYWPDTTMSKSGYVSNTTSIYNYPVQSLATADIIPLAVGWLWRKMKELNMKSFIVNTVHDSIIAEVPEEEVALYSKLADEAISRQTIILLKEIFNIDFNFPLEAEIKTGSHWGG